MWLILLYTESYSDDDWKKGRDKVYMPIHDKRQGAGQSVYSQEVTNVWRT